MKNGVHVGIAASLCALVAACSSGVSSHVGAVAGAAGSILAGNGEGGNSSGAHGGSSFGGNAGGTTSAGAGASASAGVSSSSGGLSASSGGTPANSGGALGSGGSELGSGGSAAGGGASGGVSSGGSAGAAVMSGGSGGALASPVSTFNGIQWADSSGNPIQAHGGGIIKVGDYYYWFGENRNPNNTFFAVSCYRSSDLVHWEFRSNVLTQSSASELKSADIERPKVIYNASTGKYVMWMHWENGSDYSASHAAVAVADSVDGAYSYLGSARPLVSSGVMDHGVAGYQSRDSTAFVDSDGKGYFISSTNENSDLNLYLLKSDYLSIDSLAAVLFKGARREAPALWKRNGVYFLLSSAATGWDPNQAEYATSTSLTSGWSGLSNIGDATTFHSQAAFVLPVQGTAGTAYLYMGDRWAGAWSGPVNDSTYVWIPLSFASNTSASMAWSNTLTIDAGAGSLSGATNHFAYLGKSSGKAMSAQNGSSSSGAAVVQSAYTNAKSQEWDLNYDSAGYFDVTNVNSSLVLDVNSSSTADGASLLQFTNNSGDNQKWRIVDAGGGAYQLLNKHSGKVVEVPADSNAEGATLDQKSSTSGAANQLWQMTVAK